MDDKMKNDDLDRKLGGTGREDEGSGHQTPGRNPQDDRSAGQQGGKQGKEPRGRDEDDEVDIGQTNKNR
jgi:hypothetical protein